MLRDAEAEVLFCFSLEESLKRAHAAPLFKVRIFEDIIVHPLSLPLCAGSLVYVTAEQ